MAIMRASINPQEYIEGANLYRDALIAEYAGPRLKAGIGGSRSFMSQEFWATNPDGPAQLLPPAESEHAAIRRRHPAAARQACLDRTDLMADLDSV